ncbi:MAG: hypothetical protein NTV29_18495, partial [Planctomycetota bacterium]|nr:hypothetical protein [Planctomycetota bacterium]
TSTKTVAGRRIAERINCMRRSFRGWVLEIVGMERLRQTQPSLPSLTGPYAKGPFSIDRADKPAQIASGYPS